MMLRFLIIVRREAVDMHKKRGENFVSVQISVLLRMCYCLTVLLPLKHVFTINILYSKLTGCQGVLFGKVHFSERFGGKNEEEDCYRGSHIDIDCKDSYISLWNLFYNG